MSWLEELGFLNPWKRVERHVNALPHWQQDGATLFVTFRLDDSIPAALIQKWDSERRRWFEAHPKPWTEAEQVEFQDRFSRRWEMELDRGHGCCVLERAEVVDELAGVLTAFDGERYQHHCWVIMPNHVHLLFTLAPGQLLEKVMQGWKGVSSRRIHAALGRSGTLWQKDYFDRMIRDGEHFVRCARYIRKNPVKAGLSEGRFRLFESPEVKRLLR